MIVLYMICRLNRCFTSPGHSILLEWLMSQLEKLCYIFPSLFFSNRFDRDWKKIEAYVGSKTVIQV
jgi:hypothetical protein